MGIKGDREGSSTAAAAAALAEKGELRLWAAESIAIANR